MKPSSGGGEGISDPSRDVPSCEAPGVDALGDAALLGGCQDMADDWQN
jgi:hypothetical protein